MFFRHEGKCYALEDRCPHRGVPLSVGRCEFPGTSTISCAYHGWTYDLNTGECVGAVTDGPDSPIVGKVGVRTYPVEERKGLVWVYIGDGEVPRLEELAKANLRSVATAVAAPWRKSARYRDEAL